MVIYQAPETDYRKSGFKYNVPWLDEDGAHTHGLEGEAYPPQQEAAFARRVEVVAPCDLKAGYELTVEVQGIPFLVEVPEGGVEVGDRFIARVIKKLDKRDADDDEESGDLLSIDASSSKASIPVGEWRDGLFNCFTYGWFHMSFCLAFWCSPLALGQVMTRLNLDGFARPKTNHKLGYRDVDFSPFHIMAFVFGTFILVDNVLSILTIPRISAAATSFDEYGQTIYTTSEIPGWVIFFLLCRDILRILFFVYVVTMAIKTRKRLRQSYEIPDECCRGGEDFCYSFFCNSCSVSQMMRHTTDYYVEEPKCCSKTGVAEGL